MRRTHMPPPATGAQDSDSESFSDSTPTPPDPMGEWLVQFRQLEAKAEAAEEANPDRIGLDNLWNHFLGDLFAEAVAAPPEIRSRESAAGAFEVIAQDLSALGPIQDAIGRALAAYLGASWTPTPWTEIGVKKEGRGPAPAVEAPLGSRPEDRPPLPELLAWFRLEEAAQDLYWARYASVAPKTNEEAAVLEDWNRDTIDAFLESIRPEQPRIYSFSTAARAWTYLEVEAAYTTGTWWRAVAVELGDFLRMIAATENAIEAHKPAKREG